jgi:hypothetical protein
VGDTFLVNDGRRWTLTFLINMHEIQKIGKNAGRRGYPFGQVTLDIPTQATITGLPGPIPEVGLVVASYVVVGSQTAVDSLSSDPRCLAVGCWGQWVTTQHRQPSRNVREVAKRLV